MAKAPPKAAAEPDDSGDESGAAAGKKKKLILLAVIAVVLLAVCGGGTFAAMHFLGGDQAAPVAADEHGAGAEGEGEGAEPQHAALIYFPFDPPFLTNFVVNGRPRYLQLSLTVASRDQATVDAVQKHLPLLRNRIVLLLSGEQFDQLRMRAGREALQGKLLAAIKEILEKEGGKADVDNLLFTNFVMQ